MTRHLAVPTVCVRLLPIVPSVLAKWGTSVRHQLVDLNVLLPLNVQWIKLALNKNVKIHATVAAELKLDVKLSNTILYVVVHRHSLEIHLFNASKKVFFNKFNTMLLYQFLNYTLRIETK